MFRAMRTNRVATMALAGLLMGAAGAPASAAVYYVNANNPLLNGNGSSWSAAARHLNDVLPLAQAGDEIWVAAGVYYADRTMLAPLGTGDRDATFTLISGVKLRGGFVGGETRATQANPSLNVTILSGEINDPNALGDNSRTILTAYNVDANALVDGFVFQRGYCEDGSPAAQDATAMGAAIFMGNSHFTINRCVFEHNRARGGAAIGALDSSPKIMNCTFRNGWGANRGGAIDFWNCPNPQIHDCEFRSNSSIYGGHINANSYTGGHFSRCTFIQGASVNGGALSFAGFSNTLISNSLFLRNECKQLQYYQTSFDGGAVRNWCANTMFVNCIFNSNWANGAGAALWDAGPSGASSTTINCTFFNNTCRDGGVVAAASGHTPTMKNGLLWNNGTSPFAGSVTVHNSMSGSGGSHFVDADGADDLVGTEDDDLRLVSWSSWVNAGDNSHVLAEVATDYLGNPRINEGTVDLGAIEYYAPPPPVCYGDANGDRVVNFDDITEVLANWLTAGPSGDADHNGVVNFDDITQVITTFNQACPS